MLIEGLQPTHVDIYWHILVVELLGWVVTHLLYVYSKLNLF